MGNQATRKVGYAQSSDGQVQIIKKPKVEKKKKKFKLSSIFHMGGTVDRSFVVIVFVLLAFGIVMMYSASYIWALEEAGDGSYYLKQQAFAAALGVIVMIVVSTIDYHILANTKMAYGIFLSVSALMLYTCFFGIEHNNARRWVKIFIEFQPSEIMKCALVIIFAYLISANYKRFDKLAYATVPFGLILGMVGLMMAGQRHFSGLLLMGIIGLAMIFIGGVPWKHFAKILIVAGIGSALIIAYKVIVDGFGYFIDRFKNMFDPFSDIQGTTWQTYQSLLAIGSGGVSGLGFGQSKQKFLYLSESHNDFVFAIICEELGLLGALLVILLFLLFILRGFYIASKAPDKFGMMLVVGITIQIGVQAILNIAVACNAFPNTGISLPFFSYGGTALAMQLAEMGIILSVSRQCNTD